MTFFSFIPAAPQALRRLRPTAEFSSSKIYLYWVCSLERRWIEVIGQGCRSRNDVGRERHEVWHLACVYIPSNPLRPPPLLFLLLYFAYEVCT